VLFFFKKGVEFVVSYLWPIVKHRWKKHSAKVDSTFALGSNVLMSVVKDTVNTVVDVNGAVEDVQFALSGGESTEEGARLASMRKTNVFKDHLYDTHDAQPTVLGHYIMEHPEDVTSKYADQTIQFAYMTCFANSFPLGPLIAFVNNVFVLRFDIRYA
jgi:hypothetical protein